MPIPTATKLKSPVVLITYSRACPGCGRGMLSILTDRSNPRPNAVARYCPKCGWAEGDRDTLLSYLAEVSPKFHLPGTEPPPSKWRLPDEVADHIDRECDGCHKPLHPRQQRFCSLACSALVRNRERAYKADNPSKSKEN